MDGSDVWSGMISMIWMMFVSMLPCTRTDGLSRTQYTLHLYPTFLEPTPQHPVSLYLKIHSPLPPPHTNKHTSSHHPDLLHTQIYRSTEAPRDAPSASTHPSTSIFHPPYPNPHPHPHPHPHPNPLGAGPASPGACVGEGRHLQVELRGLLLYRLRRVQG